MLVLILIEIIIITPTCFSDM